MMSLVRTLRAYIFLSIHLLVVFFNLLYGIWKLSKLPYAPISIFGGTHLKKDCIYLKQAHELAKLLALEGMSVLTGGGPGIMEAANCGAYSSSKNKKVITTMGIGVRGLDEKKGFNKCAKNAIVMRYFFSRKWLLINYSRGFAIFPGGFGTVDELCELLTLIQTNLRKKAPIVLIGVEYWKYFMQWLVDNALSQGFASEEDIALFTVTDDVHEAFQLLKAAYKKEPFSIFT